MTPKVSVLCLCYNQERFIIESLNSLKNQSYSDYEVLIIDDCSKDESVKVVENWIIENPNINIRFIKHSENKGICKSLNELLILAKGIYIQMLALDDVLLEWKLEKHVEILDKSNDYQVLVFSDAYLIDGDSNLYQNRFIALYKNYLSIESGNFYSNLLENNFIPAMSVLIKKQSIVSIGGWDEELTYEDYDMWLRLAQKGYEFIFDDKLSCKYRLHDNNTHQTPEMMFIPTYEIFIKHTENKIARKKIEEFLMRKYLVDEDTSRVRHYFNLVRPTKISQYLMMLGISRVIVRVLNKLRL